MSTQLNRDQALRYNRQIVLPAFDLDGQEALLDSGVLMIGAGGLGCASAQYLVSAGLGHLTLVDDDVVEISNLQRQVLHSEQTLGLNKAESARQQLQILNPSARIVAINERLSDEQLCEQINQHHLVVDCTDNLASREQINRLCYRLGKPLVSGAAIRMEGQVISFIPGPQSPCYACMSTLFADQTLSCTEAGVMGPLVGIVGAMQAMETVKILAGFGTPLSGRLLLLDAMKMQWQEIGIPKRPDCPVCGQ